MSKPKYARYNWWPITATVGLSTAALIGAGLFFGGGNEHGASHTPGVDTMPSYATSPLQEAPRTSPLPSAQAARISAWVCRGFVFVDTKQHEVIIDPVVDNHSQRPLNFVDASASAITFDQPRPRDDYTLYVHKDGRWQVDPKGRLNRCYGGDVVTASEVHDANGTGRYVLTDSGSTVHEGDYVASDPLTAARDGLVHAEYGNMSDTQIRHFVDDLLQS